MATDPTKGMTSAQKTQYAKTTALLKATNNQGNTITSSGSLANNSGKTKTYSYSSDGKEYTATTNNAGGSTPVVELGNVNPVTVPEKPVSPFTPIVPQKTTTIEEQDTTAKDNLDAYITELKKNFEDQPSQEDAFYEAEKLAGIKNKQREVQNYTDQINTLVAQQQSDIMQIRNQSSAEGGTAGILSAREDAINRSAAIKILPLQAQQAAAQGNLEMAQERLSTIFDLKMKDAEQKFAYQTKVLDASYDYMTREQQNKADEIKQQKQNEFTLYRDEMNNLASLRDQAAKDGNWTLASKLMTLDPNDVTYASDLERTLKSYGGTSTSVKAPTIQKINGVDMQWDATTGMWVKPSTSVTTGQDLTQDQMGISSVDDLLNNTVGASTAVGTSFLSRSTGFWGNIGRVLLGTLTGAGTGAAAGSVVPGVGTVAGGIIGAGTGLIGALSQTGKQAYSQLSGSEQSFIGSVEQLVSGLTLDSLIKAKAEGATFGALSEGEMNVLSQSATKIGKWAKKDSDGNVVGYNIDEKSFKKELQTINNMAKLDYIRKGGNPEDIAVNVTPDGKMWVRNWEGKLEEIRTY